MVDADAEILDSFNFDYKPTEYDSQYVHIWNAFNPAIGLDYGYGGVKLFSKKLFANITTQLDFSTTLATGIKLMPQIACITRFNSDPFRAYRGAFRETAKLYRTVNSESIPKKERDDARHRLACWIDPTPRCAYARYVADGARAGMITSKQHLDDVNGIMFINDHALLQEMFAKAYPEVDLNTNPSVPVGHPMKHELFFTTRIASALYDPLVIENLPLTELRDAISDGQMLSKVWLTEELQRLIADGQLVDMPRVAIVGGWIGTLALLMNSWELPVSITSVDLDERANRIAEKLNYDFDFRAVTKNMFELDYSQFDVIINTSSEHIEDIGRWRDMIPAGKILMVQNNDYLEAEGHISNVQDSTELREKLKLSEVLYEGTRKFPQYSRFMIIGRT